MHISDGVLPFAVTIGGYAASAGLAAWSARSIHSRKLPKVAVVTSAFLWPPWCTSLLAPPARTCCCRGLPGPCWDRLLFWPLAWPCCFKACCFSSAG